MDTIVCGFRDYGHAQEVFEHIRRVGKYDWPSWEIVSHLNPFEFENVDWGDFALHIDEFNEISYADEKFLRERYSDSEFITADEFIARLKQERDEYVRPSTVQMLSAALAVVKLAASRDEEYAPLAVDMEEWLKSFTK